MSVVRMAVRHLGEAAGPAINLAIVVLLTSFVLAAVPRILARAADTTLRDAVADAPVDVRGLQLLALGRIQAGGDDPLAGVAASGRTLMDEVPAAIRSLVAAQDVVIDTSRWIVTSRRVPETTVRLRLQPGAVPHLRILRGRLPSGTAGTMPAPTTVTGESRLAPVTVFEVALPAESARVLGTDVGETLVLGLDPTNLRTNLDHATVAIRVVGIVEMADPASDYWFGDRLLAGPSIRSLSQLSQVQDLTALVAPAEYPALVGATAFAPPLTYAWRLAVDPGRLEAASIDTTVTALRRLESIFSGSVPRFVAGADPAAGAGFRSGLLGVITAEQDRWGSALAVLSVSGIGAAAVALAALALSAMLLGRRGTRALGTWRARGASRAQLAGGVAAEAGVIVAPAAAAGALGALFAIAGGSVGTGAILAGGFGVVAVASVVVAAPIRAEAPADRLRRRNPRRVVFEVLVVGLAALGGILLRARGLQGASASGGVAPADPFVAAVPALFGLAAGIVALRAFPLPMRLLASIAARRRDLVPVLALRRLTRGASNGGILLVLLAMATISTFAAVTLVYLDRAAETISWADVGAPFRLDTTDPAGIPDLLDPATLPGVTARAGAFTGRETVVGRGVHLQLVTIDVGDEAALAADTPADPAFPPELAASEVPGASGGTGAAVFPVIVSADLASSPAALHAGSTFQLAMEAGGALRSVSFRAVDARASFPGVQAGTSFVVASRDQLRRALPDLTLPTTRLYLRAPEANAGALRAAVAARVPGSVVAVSDRAAEAAAVRASPYVRVVSGGVLLAALLAIAYALLAVVAGLALSGASRAVELAHLRALGLAGSRAFGLVLLEHGPTVCLAVAAGAALGIGLFVFLQPGLGLSAIIGSNVDVPLAFDPSVLGLVLAGSLAVLGIAIIVAAAAERHADPGQALRRGIE